MKKVIIAVICTLAFNGFSQDEKTWRLGVQIGNQSNHSKFVGGMTDANARFNHANHSAGALSVVFRYDLNNHWMFMSGLGISSYGFQYSLSQNYSLLAHKKNSNQYVGIQSSFGAIELPAMVFYKFNPNCKNARWLIGAGFAQALNAAQTASNSANQSNDGTSNVNYLSSTSSVKGGLNLFLRWSVAREKTYKNGGILNASLLLNVGFNKIAGSTVNYTIDNQNYTHTFSNHGNFVGFRLAYFFKPFQQTYKTTKNPAVIK